MRLLGRGGFSLFGEQVSGNITWHIRWLHWGRAKFASFPIPVNADNFDVRLDVLEVNHSGYDMQKITRKSVACFIMAIFLLFSNQGSARSVPKVGGLTDGVQIEKGQHYPSVQNLPTALKEVFSKSQELRQQHWFAPKELQFQSWTISNSIQKPITIKVNVGHSIMTRVYALNGSSLKYLWEDGYSAHLDHLQHNSPPLSFVFVVQPNEPLELIFESLPESLNRISFEEFASSYQKTSNQEKILYIYVGLALCLLVYNLFLGVSLRQKIYGYYVGVILSQHLIHRTFYQGFLNDIFSDKAIYVFIASVCGLALFNTYFICEFLRVKERSVLLYRLLVVFSWTAAIIAANQVWFFPGYFGDPYGLLHVFRTLSNLCFASLCILCLVTFGLSIFKYNDFYGKLLTLSWSPILFGAMYWVMAAIGIVSWDYWANHGLTIASAFEGILLSFALAYRHRLLEIKLRKQQTSQAKLDAELNAAAKIQNSLLAVGEKVPALDIHYAYIPAKETGGDWLGYYYDELNHICFIGCADVTGHGLPAALLTGVATGAVEVTLSNVFKRRQRGYNPSDVIQEIFINTNDAILRRSGLASRGMTMALLAVDVKTGALWYGNAGHCLIIIVEKDRYVTSLITPGQMLGVTNQFIPGEVERVHLQKNDSVVLYTDGLFDNVGPMGESLSPRFFKKQLNGQTFESSEGLLDFILNSATNLWQDQPLIDDTALSIYRWTGWKKSSEKAS